MNLGEKYEENLNRIDNDIKKKMLNEKKHLLQILTTEILKEII